MAVIKLGQLLHRATTAPIDENNPLNVAVSGTIVETIYSNLEVAAGATVTTPVVSSTSREVNAGVYCPTGGSVTVYLQSRLSDGVTMGSIGRQVIIDNAALNNNRIVSVTPAKGVSIKRCLAITNPNATVKTYTVTMFDIY